MGLFKALLGGDDDDLLARLDSFASKIKGFSYFALYEAIRKAHRPTLGGDLLVRTRQAARQHPAPTRSDALTDQAGTAA